MWQQVLKIRSEGLNVLWQQSLVGGGGGGGGGEDHRGTADSPAGPPAAQTNYGVAVHCNVKLVKY